MLCLNKFLHIGSAGNRINAKPPEGITLDSFQIWARFTMSKMLDSLQYVFKLSIEGAHFKLLWQLEKR